MAVTSINYFGGFENSLSNPCRTKPTSVVTLEQDLREIGRRIFHSTSLGSNSSQPMREEIPSLVLKSPELNPILSPTNNSPKLSSDAKSNGSSPASESSTGSLNSLQPLVLSPSTPPHTEVKVRSPEQKPLIRHPKSERTSSPFESKVPAPPLALPPPIQILSSFKTQMCFAPLHKPCALSDEKCRSAHHVNDLRVRAFIDLSKKQQCHFEKGFPPGLFVCNKMPHCSKGHLSESIIPFRSIMDAAGNYLLDSAGQPIIEWLLVWKQRPESTVGTPIRAISQANAEMLNSAAKSMKMPLPIIFHP